MVATPSLNEAAVKDADAWANPSFEKMMVCLSIGTFSIVKDPSAAVVAEMDVPLTDTATSTIGLYKLSVTVPVTVPV